jgi:Na+-transporting NADH:ubiquinone oxidoreductase subunit NqrF
MSKERGHLGSSKNWETENVRAVTGLVVVLVGVLAVVALAMTAVILLGSGNRTSVVAVTTSALGIISAVVSGYLGIKATANTAAKTAAITAEKSGEAAVAQNEVRVKKSKVDRLNEEIDRQEKAEQIKPKVAKELRDASVKAEEEARRTDPPQGGAG